MHSFLCRENVNEALRTGVETTTSKHKEAANIGRTRLCVVFVTVRDGAASLPVCYLDR
jgi:hypothetical protein